MQGPANAFLSTAGARAIDRQAVEEYGMPSILLMENAARGAFVVLRRYLALRADVVVVCGPGNNGGDGYGLSRYILNFGADVRIGTVGEPRVGDLGERSDASVQRQIAQQMAIPIDNWRAWAGKHPEVIVDAIFGTGVDRPVRGEAAACIEWINQSRQVGTKVVALDLPSGVEGDRGEIMGCAVEADLTATFVAWKKGFLNPVAREKAGEIEVVELGIPRALVERYLEHA